MFIDSFAAGTFFSFIQSILSIPVNTTKESIATGHTKRWETGPQMDGANFPDPSIIKVDGAWYSFATRTIGSTLHIQCAYSPDFQTWSIVNNEDGSQHDALPYLPTWVDVSSPNTWAPDVQQLDDGTFIMYYSASTVYDHTKHCVGAAVSKTVLGPYAPYTSPLICPLSQGGAIDAAGYNDNGQRYIVYKVDGNAIGHGGACGNENPPLAPTPIMLQPVYSDGVTLHGLPIPLLDHQGAGDAGTVEGPSLVRASDHYVLFFSSGCFKTTGYNVNYATAPSISGPYTRATRPLLVTGDYGLVAPGGMSIDSDGLHMLFHADFGTGRALYNAEISADTIQVIA